MFTMTAWSGWTTRPLLQINQTNDTMRYALYTPATETGKKYPLVIFLHGNGGSSICSTHTEVFFDRVLDTSIQNHTPCYLMAPACPQTTRQPKWANTDWGLGSYSLAAVPISISMQLLKDAIYAVCGSNQIDTNRIELAGGSMGGYGAWDAILRYPTLFASSSPVSGAGDPTHAADIVHVPVWAFADASDALCPPSGSRDMITAMRAAGSFPHYSEFNTGFYHLWDQCWDPGSETYTPENVPWIMRQVKTTAAPSKPAGLTATAAGSYAVNLSWQAADDGVGDPRRIHYFIYRDGKQIGPSGMTLDSTRYTDADSTLRENTAYSYTVRAINDNSYAGPLSDPASVTTPADATPPVLLEAQDAGDATHVILAFSERLDPASAQSKANYASDMGLAVSQAVLQPGSKSVLLTVSTMTPHATYTLTVNGVKDQTTKNTVAANSSVRFAFEYLSGLRYDYYEFPGYPSNPPNLDSLAQLTPKVTGIAQSINVDAYKQQNEYFILRFTGFLQIPEAGQYEFLVSADDQCVTSIDNKLLVDTRVSGAKRVVIQLTRGMHPLAVSYLQGCCGYALLLKWRRVTDAMMQPIPGAFLFHSPEGGTAAVSSVNRLAHVSALAIRALHGKALIAFTLGDLAPGNVIRAAIFDMRGRSIRALVDASAQAGRHEVAFDLVDNAGNRLSPGTYVVRVQAGAMTMTGVLSLTNRR